MVSRYLALACVLILAVCSGSLTSIATESSPPIYLCRDAGAGGYQAFPDVCRLNDGRLMCAFYASYHHVGLPCREHPKGGRIVYCTSSDEGHSWSKPEMLFDGPEDDRDPSLVQLKDGRLICNFFTLHRAADSSKPCPNPFKESYSLSGTWTVVSSDGGRTWNHAKKLYDTHVCSSPIRQLSNGRLVMPLYAETLGPNSTARGAAAVSDDGGKTWSTPVDIDNAGIRLDAETDLLELCDGRLWAIQRSSGSPACFSISDTSGDTWTRSQPLSFVAHSPYLLRVKPDNLVVLGYRGYRTFKGVSTGFTALRCSRDECKTWGDAVVVDDVVGAYPSMVQLLDGSVLIVYYDEGYPSSIRVKRFRAPKSGIEWLQP